MNLKTGRKPFGIAFRMLLLMVVFISLIFSAIFISFNFFIGDYVERDMTNQLENAVNDIIQNRESILAEVPYRQIRGTVLVNPRDLYVAVVKYLRNKNEHSEVNTVIYSPADYTRYFPDSEDGIIQSINNLNEIDELINIISENIWTEENIIYRTPALPGDYYFTSVDLSSLYYLNGFYALFYVNSGKYDDFTSDIYFMLLIILLVAMIFTILYVTFISRSISKPLRKLCSFADEIGRGNFSRSEYSFKDRELIDLNERMNQTAAKLEKNDEDRKIFFQNVSHELKTPLMSVRGYAEGIKYKIFEDGKELDSAVNIIISESERLDNLVSDLLYVSKIDSSDFISDKNDAEKTDLVNLAESCAEKLRGLIINQEKEIKVICPENKKIYINCREEAVMRALMNVTANCVQYAESLVEILFYETDKSVSVRVRDDGPGIDASDLPNIFKRFYKGKEGKHGIGLSIAKSVAERHGARITAGNRSDVSGAEFIIEFIKN